MGFGWAEKREEDILEGGMAPARAESQDCGNDGGQVKCWGRSLQGAYMVARPGSSPKAGVSSPGSAIAYSAYTFPDTLVCTTFHDYYVAMAVLNTILSTGLSCYSRYWVALTSDGRGGRVFRVAPCTL